MPIAADYRARVERVLWGSTAFVGDIWRADGRQVEEAAHLLRTFAGYTGSSIRLNGAVARAGEAAASGVKHRVIGAFTFLWTTQTDVDRDIRLGLLNYAMGRPEFPHAFANLCSALLYQVDGNRVFFSPHAGGFANIVHGGLPGAALAKWFEFKGMTQPGPFTLLTWLRGPVRPASVVSVAPMDDIAVGASLTDRQNNILAQATYAPLSKVMDIKRVGLDSDLRHISFEGRCMAACVAAGTETPLGLDRTIRVHGARLGEGARLSTWLDETTGTGLRPQLTLADDLGWWGGRWVTDQAGFTSKISYWRWRQPEVGSRLWAIADGFRLGRKEGRATTHVSFVADDGRVMAEADVSYVARPDRAKAAMGEAGLGPAAGLDGYLSTHRG